MKRYVTVEKPCHVYAAAAQDVVLNSVQPLLQHRHGVSFPAPEVVLVLEEDRAPAPSCFCVLLAGKAPCHLFHLSHGFHFAAFCFSPPPFLFVNKFNKALAEVVKVKDLDVQYFYGPLDLGIHAISFLQRVAEVLLCVLDAAL